MGRHSIALCKMPTETVRTGCFLVTGILTELFTVSVFGEDAGVLNFDRPFEVLGRMMTFNGNENDIIEGMKKGDPNMPVRRCPGYDYALSIIEFLVDRFMPPDQPPISDDYKKRLDEIKSKESYFMRFVLWTGKKTYAENNEYFPHASEVIHPMDTAGEKLGSEKIIAAGGRTIPKYGKPT